MKKQKLPKRKRRLEIIWRTLDATIIAAVVCIIFAFFTHDPLLSIMLSGLALASIITYFLIEHKLEYELVTLHRIKNTAPSQRDSIANFIIWGVVISGLAIGNFFLHFMRHDIMPADVPTTAPIYQSGLALMFLTVVACLLAHVLHHGFHFSRNLKLVGIHKARTIKSYILAVLYTFIGVYILLRILRFDTDVDLALLAALLYVGFREFQRYDRKNRRKVVRLLHKEIKINNDLKF